MVHDDVVAHAARGWSRRGRRAVRPAAPRAAGAPGVLVGAGVGDHQRLGGGPDRVEQELAVLGADVALTGHRDAGQRVVAVDEPSRGKTPSSRPTRQTTRCGTERIGTIVHTVSVPVRKFARVGPAGEMSTEQRAHVGQPQLGVGASARVGQHLCELALHLTGLPRVGRRRRGSACRRRRSGRRASRSSGRVPLSARRSRCSRSTYSAKRPARSMRLLPTSSSGSVGVDPGVRVVGHRDAGEDPVKAEPPGVLGEVVKAVRRAMVVVETPPNARLAHPARDRVEVVVGEAEPGAYRRRPARG